MIGTCEAGGATNIKAATQEARGGAQLRSGKVESHFVQAHKERQNRAAGRSAVRDKRMPYISHLSAPGSYRLCKAT